MSLANLACAIGTVVAVLNISAFLAPGLFRKMVLSFPRNKAAAWVLTAVDLYWVAWIVLHAALGRFEFLKPYIYFAAPVSFLLIIFFMDELLAPRALGGFILLLADPILTAARWHPSNWRYVMTVLAYVWVIAGIIFVLSPYRLRQLLEFGTKTDWRCRVGGAIRFLAGVALVYLGLRVY